MLPDSRIHGKYLTRSKKILDQHKKKLFTANQKRHRKITVEINSNVLAIEPVHQIKLQSDLYFRVMGPVIRFAQFFNALPVQNVLAIDVNDIGFKWKSFLTFNMLASIAWILFEFGIITIKYAGEKIGLESIAGCVYFTTTLIGQICLLHLSMRWGALMRYWSECEIIFLRSPYTARKITLKLKIYVSISILIVMAMGEQLIYLVRLFYDSYTLKVTCQFDMSLFNIAYQSMAQHIYRLFGYHYIWFWLVQWTSLTRIVQRTYFDAIIISMSLGLVDRFQQFIDRMQSLRGHKIAKDIWTECREHYNRLTNLVERINQDFAFLILLSCFNNMFAVCKELFNFKTIKLPFLTEQVYFAFTFGFLIFRLLFVLLSCAQINVLARLPLHVVRNIPTNSWNIETERFALQLQNDFVAISGYMFAITRQLVLAMTGTILTYVFIVLDEINKSPGQKRKWEDMCSN